ncbi:6491_t:CDS:2, partial [Gigaspora rosea]
HIQKEIEIMEKDGIIQKSLNSTTKKDTYPLPRIDEMLDNLGNTTKNTSYQGLGAVLSQIKN